MLTFFFAVPGRDGSRFRSLRGVSRLGSSLRTLSTRPSSAARRIALISTLENSFCVAMVSALSFGSRTGGSAIIASVRSRFSSTVMSV